MNIKKLLTLILVVFCLAASAKKKIDLPEIIVINMGAKNPQFNESRFPDLKFYYIETMVPERKETGTTNAALVLSGVASVSLTGKPDFLVDWNSKANLVDHAMVFDKNGVCVYEATLKDDILKTQSPDNEKLEDVFKDYVKKGKEGKLKKKKEFEVKRMKTGWKNDAMMNIQLPEDFELTDAKGNKLMAKEIIEAEKPVMVILINIPANVDLESGKDADQSQKSGKQFFADAAQAAAGEKWTSILIKLESQLFGFDARE